MVRPKLQLAWNFSLFRLLVWEYLYNIKMSFSVDCSQILSSAEIYLNESDKSQKHIPFTHPRVHNTRSCKRLEFNHSITRHFEKLNVLLLKCSERLFSSSGITAATGNKTFRSYWKLVNAFESSPLYWPRVNTKTPKYRLSFLTISIRNVLGYWLIMGVRTHVIPVDRSKYCYMMFLLLTQTGWNFIQLPEMLNPIRLSVVKTCAYLLNPYRCVHAQGVPPVY